MAENYLHTPSIIPHPDGTGAQVNQPGYAAGGQQPNGGGGDGRPPKPGRAQLLSPAGDERPVLQPGRCDDDMERATEGPDLPPFPLVSVLVLIDVNAT